MKKASICSIVFITSVLFAFGIDKTNQASIFLNALNKEQRNKALMNFENSSKHDWHYLPATMHPRPGIALYELNSHQKQILFNLLRSSLSESGFAKTQQIISLENILAEITGNKVVRDPEKYYAAFYGNPAEDNLWAWSFQGHHLSLNFTILDGKTSIAPRFLGANPATVQEGKRKGERTLARENDLGLKLINSCSAEQKKKAIFRQDSYFDIITSNSAEVDPLEPVGIKLKELKDSQQKILLQIIHEYLAAIPEELANARMKKLESEEKDEIRFGWAGAIQPGIGHYYRIQGKTFLIEFDNTQTDYLQNKANHIHSVWRDFDGDFGRDLIREHYQHSDHHH